MPFTAKIKFTGLCSFLLGYDSIDRVLLPYANRMLPSCDPRLPIPVHHAYIRYQLEQVDEQLSSLPDVVEPKRKLGAIFLNGDEIIVANAYDSPPPPSNKIDLVPSMADVDPNLRLSDAALKSPKELSHSLVTGYFLLNKGKILGPTPDDAKKWHFFPQKGHEDKSRTLPQEVTYRMRLSGEAFEILLRPFGTDVYQRRLVLKPKAETVSIIVGNTIFDDIFPKDKPAKPALGPDRHFEIYYRLANPQTVKCPLSIPHYEGDGTEVGHGGGHPLLNPPAEPEELTSSLDAVRFAAAGGNGNPGTFDTVDGANCPPNQWP